jgi:peptide/nickel transport system ATP-binding protein
VCACAAAALDHPRPSDVGAGQVGGSAGVEPAPDLKDEFGLTYLFISHDLNVVRFISDRVMVMYLGQVVEIGTSVDLLEAPRHKYTKALLSKIPSMDPDHRTEVPPLAGDPPNPINPPAGCRFHPRCAMALQEGSGTHPVACLIFEPGSGHSDALAVAA